MSRRSAIWPSARTSASPGTRCPDTPGRAWSPRFPPPSSPAARAWSARCSASWRTGDHLLLPNVDVNTTIIIGSKQDAITVPREAVREDGNRNYVYLLKDGHLHRQEVKLGISNLTRVEIAQRRLRRRRDRRPVVQSLAHGGGCRSQSRRESCVTSPARQRNSAPRGRLPVGRLLCCLLLLLPAAAWAGDGAADDPIRAAGRGTRR